MYFTICRSLKLSGMGVIPHLFWGHSRCNEGQDSQPFDIKNKKTLPSQTKTIANFSRSVALSPPDASSPTWNRRAPDRAEPSPPATSSLGLAPIESRNQMTCKDNSLSRTKVTWRRAEPSFRMGFAPPPVPVPDLAAPPVPISRTNGIPPCLVISPGNRGPDGFAWLRHGQRPRRACCPHRPNAWG